MRRASTWSSTSALRQFPPNACIVAICSLAAVSPHMHALLLSVLQQRVMHRLWCEHSMAPQTDQQTGH